MKRYILFTLLFSITGIGWTSAQTKVTGKVMDASNATPIVAVTVAVKGTTTGTYTDDNGNYSITVPTNGTLVFNYLGYGVLEEKVNGRTVINVNMLPEAALLDEVVVTSTGKRPTRSLGYSMSELKGSEVAGVNTINPINAIQGKVAGVQINMGNSGPQSAQRILIRGNTSLGDNNQPIFVVDGIIIDNTTTGPDKWGSGLDFGNEMKNLNPDDFESMSILKGAAATALYGSRASNGVILITTKKGRKGSGIGVSVSHSQMWEKAYAGPDFQNEFGPGESQVWSLDANGNDIRQTSSGYNFGPAFDGKPFLYAGEEQMYAAVPNNALDALQTGRYVNTNVAVSGGSEVNTFRLSYSNTESNGMYLNNSYLRNNFSANVTQKISKYLDAEAGATFTESKAENPMAQGGGFSLLYDFIYQPRNYDTKYWLDNYKNGDGTGANYDDVTGYTNKLWDRLENNRVQKETTARGYVDLNFHLTDWLNVRLKGDLYRYNTNRENKILGDGSPNYGGSSYSVSATHKEQYKMTGMINAFKNINKDLNLNATVAVEQWDTRSGYSSASTSGGLKVPGLFDLSNSNNRVESGSGDYSYMRENTDRKRINSIYGFVNLDWKNQLYLDFTARNDWSSALKYPDGSGNNSYFYPSVSTSWIFSDTFRDNIADWISFGKLRGSYAIVGNDTRQYVTNQGYYQYSGRFKNPLNGNEYSYYGFDSNSLRNLDLKPERSHAIEFGAEGRFFDNRIRFDFAYYKTNTYNQILELDMPAESGVGKKWINAGNIQNAGVELVLGGTPIQTNHFTWDVTWNFTRNRSKIVELAPGVDKYLIEAGNLDTYLYAEVGGKYGTIYTPYAYLPYQHTDENGKPVDHPNNGKPTLGNATGSYFARSGEYKAVGSMDPKFLTGLLNEFRYKEFTLNVLLDARFGGDIVSGTYNYGHQVGTLQSTTKYRTQEYGGVARTLADGRVVYDGVIQNGVFPKGTKGKDGKTDITGMTFQEAYDKGLVNPVRAMAYYANLYSWGTGIREEAVYECSWISLREISLWWRMPKKWASKMYVQALSVGLVGRNLAYLYNSLPDNIHPEGLYSNRTSAFVEVGGTAYSRTYGFTVNVTF